MILGVCIFRWQNWLHGCTLLQARYSCLSQMWHLVQWRLGEQPTATRLHLVVRDHLYHPSHPEVPEDQSLAAIATNKTPCQRCDARMLIFAIHKFKGLHTWWTGNVMIFDEYRKLSRIEDHWILTTKRNIWRRIYLRLDTQNVIFMYEHLIVLDNSMFTTVTSSGLWTTLIFWQYFFLMTTPLSNLTSFIPTMLSGNVLFVGNNKTSKNVYIRCRLSTITHGHRLKIEGI